MKSSMIKNRLSLAVIALFAAGCSATQPVAMNEPPQPVSYAGPAGPSGPVGSWTPFRDFWFDSNRSDLQASDSGKVSEIANYLRQNPGQQVGIDGSLDRNNTDLSNRRVSTVRNALLQAGVPSYMIQTGAFGNPQQQRDRRVQVLVNSR